MIQNYKIITREIAYAEKTGKTIKYPELKVSKIQLLDAILKEMSTEGFNETAQSDFWTEMTNLQKAKIIR